MEPGLADTQLSAPVAPNGAELSAKTVIDAITMWREAMKEAADRRANADRIEAIAIIQADGKNDAARKAQATLASVDARLRAEHAQADAKAAGAIVEMLIGARPR